MALWWVPAAISAASAVAKHVTRKAPPQFETTAQGRNLLQTSREGIYNPKARSAIIGQATGAAGTVAQQRKTGIQGYLESRGFGGSIAGARLLSEPGRERQRTVAGVSANLAIANEASKVDAARQFAEGSNRYATARLNARNQSTEALISGLSGAGISAIQGFDASTEAGRLEIPDFTGWTDDQIFDWAVKYPDQERRSGSI